MSKTDPMHIKYRPENLDEVIGQKDVVASLHAMIKSKSRPHSFLFTGPSGCGKTTLARILASEFDCEKANVIEADAATNNGIDDMRGLTEALRYSGFGASPNKMIIIDECHALSKAAWQSLLKSVEEPPPHVFFAFCTTDPGKVPDTIKTRCISYNLKPLKHDEIMDLLEMVADEEKLDVPGAMLNAVARASEGSPRQALVKFATVMDCTDDAEIRSLLEEPFENKEIVDLCRKMISRDLDWAGAAKVLSEMSEMAPESIRIVVTNYVAGCLMRAKSEKEIPRLLDVLHAFSKPCNPTDKLAPILLAIGTVLY